VQRKTFEQMMAYFNATWPERAPDAETFAAYWFALSHLDDQVFRLAAQRCVRECTFYPKPAEILARARDILDRAGLLPKSPAEAWAEVETALRRHGAYGAPKWSNPQIAETVREFGGVRTLAEMDRDRLAFLRKEWIARYAERREAVLAEDEQLMAQPLPEVKEVPALESPEDRQARIEALRRKNLERLNAITG